MDLLVGPIWNDIAGRLETYDFVASIRDFGFQMADLLGGFFFWQVEMQHDRIACLDRINIEMAIFQIVRYVLTLLIRDTHGGRLEPFGQANFEL